jgi:hypothetical protein
VFVTNDASHPVPVNVRNTTVPVHEQGTATVQGTVSARPAAPGSPWAATEDVVQGNKLVGPSSLPINVTSLTISPDTAGQDVRVTLLAVALDPGVTSCDVGVITTVWDVKHLTGPLAVAFPTPLVVNPPAGSQVCVGAFTNGDGATLNLSGFFGN